MDEAKLKEVLTKLSETSFIPSHFSNDISGWVTGSKAGHTAPKKRPRKKFSTLLTAKAIYQKRPKSLVPSIKKPISQFEFKSIHQPLIKYKKSPKKLQRAIRPASSATKSKPPSPEKKTRAKFSKISLDKTVVLNNLLSSTRRFSPNRSTGVNIFRRSSSSMTQDSTLTVHGSSCYLKTL